MNAASGELNADDDVFIEVTFLDGVSIVVRITPAEQEAAINEYAKQKAIGERGSGYGTPRKVKRYEHT